MKVIYKYEIPQTASTILKLPKGFEILSLQLQNNKLVLWLLQNKQVNNLVDYKVWPIVTGEEFKTEGIYLGTIQYNEGSFVAHYFIKALPL